MLLSNGVGEGLWKVVANLSIIGVITGLVAGVAEAIGKLLFHKLKKNFKKLTVSLLKIRFGLVR